MIKRSKFLFLIIFLTFVFATLFACSSDETSSNNGGLNNESASDNNEPDTSASADTAELSFTAWGNPAEIQVYQRAVDAFNEQHDNIHVELTPAPGDNYAQTITTQLQGGEAPDVFYLHEATTSILIDNNSILSLSEFLDSPDSYVTASEFPDGMWGTAEKDGEYYALPPDANPLVMYYNIDLFEELGIQTPQEYFDEGNWNWDAMEEVTSQLRDADRRGFVADGWFAHIESWITSNGGEAFDENDNVLFDQDPAAIEAFEFVDRMLQEDNFVYSGSLPQGQGADAMFMSGQVGLVAAGRWYTPMFLEQENLNFDYITWPTNTGNEIEPAFVATAYMAVNSDTEHPQEAMKFVSFYTSEEGQLARLSDEGNAVPSVSGVDHIITEDPIPDHASYLLDARDIGYVADTIAAIPGLESEVGDIFELMYIGDKEVDEAIHEAAVAARQMIEEHQEE